MKWNLKGREAEGWFRKNWAAALIPLTPHMYLERICVLMNVAEMFVVSGVGVQHRGGGLHPAEPGAGVPGPHVLHHLPQVILASDWSDQVT